MDKYYYEAGYRLSIENAKAHYKIAELSAESNEYGIGTSLMILAAEEAIKAMICDMTAGNQDLDIGGINDIFSSHKFKHETIINVVNYFKEAQEIAMGEYGYPIHVYVQNLTNDALLGSPEFEEKIQGFDPRLKRFFELTEINSEEITQWWVQANDWKEQGFYVDRRNKSWHNPRAATRKRYEKAKKTTAQLIHIVEALSSFYSE